MTRVLPFSSKLGFGIGQLAEGVTLGAFSTFLLFYFNQILHVSGTLTGIALGIACKGGEYPDGWGNPLRL